MHDPSAAASRAAPFGWRRAMLAAPALAGCWWLFTQDPGSWVVGAPTVMVGAGMVGAMPVAAPATRLWMLPRFAPWFVWQSIRSGVDVALRALRPGLAIAPGLLARRTILTGDARVLFANTITLLPGTLSARIERDVLTIHALDRSSDLDPGLDELERRIAVVAGAPVIGPRA